MISPEVRFYPSPHTTAHDYFMEAISQLEEELDTVGNKQAAKKIEDSLEKYNQAFDALTHGHNIPVVVRFLRDQARELGKQKTDPEYFRKKQHLRCLAADLSHAA